MTQTLNLEDLKILCTELASGLQAPHLVTLEGPLGSGKTQVTTFLVEALCKKTPTHSPTFSIINKYENWKFPIYHIDLYRLKNMEDLDSTGFWDLFESECLIIVEWSNLLEDSAYPYNWPRTSILLELITHQPNLRKVSLKKIQYGDSLEK